MFTEYKIDQLNKDEISYFEITALIETEIDLESGFVVHIRDRYKEINIIRRLFKLVYLLNWFIQG